jgi:undecaprenyl-diphosphatase
VKTTLRPTVRLAETLALRELAPKSKVADVVSSGVSMAAQGGVGWAVLSAVLALRPGRTRAAARDGLLAWAAAEVVTAPMKQLIDRRRPPLKGHGLKVSSSSMPSSHTAAAVAYAVAAGARSPIVGAPAMAAAAAIGWSRLATRRHFASDVAVGAVVGAGVGAAVAMASRRVAPGENATS